MREKIVELINNTNGYHRILTDLYLQKEDGEFDKIDAVVIHETGIYVIKFEEHKGEIYGNESEIDWIQTYFVGRHDVAFSNPIKRNRAKLKNLQRFMEVLPAFHFHSIIMFNEEAELKDVKALSPHTHLLKEEQIIPFFHESLFNEPIMYTAVQVDTLYHYLKPATEVSKRVKNLYQKQQSKSSEPQTIQKRPKKISRRWWKWMLMGIILIAMLTAGYFIFLFIR